MSVSQRPPYRGEKIDLGGRALRVVRAGPRSDRPTIVLEHGAFGCAADWAVVQERLAAKGLRSLAYDRAGLGHSDPGPTPRDGRAIVADLAALLREIDEPTPYVLVGHSMGGLMVRLFALTHPYQSVGVVLVDAVTPDIIWNSLRMPIEFERTVAELEKSGPHQYVDVGPAGTLATFLKYALPSASASKTHSVLSPFGAELKNYQRLIPGRGGVGNPSTDAKHRSLYG